MCLLPSHLRKNIIKQSRTYLQLGLLIYPINLINKMNTMRNTTLHSHKENTPIILETFIHIFLVQNLGFELETPKFLDLNENPSPNFLIPKLSTLFLVVFDGST